MRWLGWLLQSKDRKLELSTGGKWYIGFTILLGIVAINSGNNVIYLLESLLLSSLLVSGVLSEAALSRLSVRRELNQAVAEKPTLDSFFVRNHGFLSLYCIEVGEWKNGQFQSFAFLLTVKGNEEAAAKSYQFLNSRGRHQWDGLAIATSFPFGFARKIRVFSKEGTRIVWPAPLSSVNELQGEESEKFGSIEPSMGEIEELPLGQDVSRVHWPSSSRFPSLMQRPWRRDPEKSEVQIELIPPSAEMERRISRAAELLQRKGKSLVMVSEEGRAHVQGTWRSLDTLALLPKERE